jgi:hypothetical protein
LVTKIWQKRLNYFATTISWNKHILCSVSFPLICVTAHDNYRVTTVKKNWHTLAAQPFNDSRTITILPIISHRPFRILCDFSKIAEDQQNSRKHTYSIKKTKTIVSMNCKCSENDRWGLSLLMYSTEYSGSLKLGKCIFSWMVANWCLNLPQQKNSDVLKVK